MALFIFAWWLASALELVDPFFLPPPFAAFEALWEMVVSGGILPDLGATVTRVAAAVLIAAVAGVPLGLLLGSVEKVYRSMEFVIDFFRSIPATALFPLFMLIFGVSDATKIAAAAFAALLIVVFNTAYGVLHAQELRKLAVRIMGAGRLQVFRLVLFRESLPQTFIGLRGAVSVALVIVVVTEMFIGTQAGLGRRIIDAQITYEIKSMYAVILLSGLLGYLLNACLLLLERRFLHWSGK